MKEKLFLLQANALAAFLDFSVGMLLTATLAQLMHHELLWYHLLIGGVLALVPDFDLVPSVIKGISAPFDHRRTLFHRPLLVIPIVSTLAYFIGGAFWGTTASCCLFWHYIHDTDLKNTQYGIAWFWPISRLYWSIHGSYTPSPGDEHHVWLKKHWFRPSRLSGSEVGAGMLLSIISLYISGILFSTIFILIGAFSLVLAIFWISTPRSY